MRIQPNDKLFLLVTLPFLLIGFIIPVASPATAILSSENGNSLVISCPEYVKGMQSINMYSNISPITSYDFKIDGRVISNSAHQARTGFASINCTDLQLTSGTVKSGNASALNAIDSRALEISAARMQCGCECDSDHDKDKDSYQVILYLDFSINDIDPSMIISGFNYSIRLNTTIVSSIQMSVKNNSRYANLVNIQGTNLAKNGKLGNTRPLPTIDAFEFKVGVSASTNFLLSIDLFHLNYVQKNSSRKLQIIDSQEIDTTKLTNGPHFLQSDVSFPSGHVAANKTIIVDNTIPKFSGIQITPAVPVDNAMITISGSVMGTNLVGTELKYDIYNETINLGDNSSLINYRINLPNGTIPVDLIASDKAGNIVDQIINLTVIHAMTIVYVPQPMPNISIYARTNVTLGDNASISVNMTRINRLNVLVNGTVNATFINRSSVLFGFIYRIPVTLNVTLRFYANGSLYLEKSVQISIVTLPLVMDPIWVDPPSFSIFARTNAAINENASLSINMTAIDVLNILVNGMLNATYHEKASILTGYIMHVPSVLNITLEFYANDSLYHEDGFEITFMNLSRITQKIYVQISQPSIAIYARVNVTMGDVATIAVNMSHVDALDVFVNGIYNATYQQNTTIEFSQNVPGLLEARLDFYVNGTVYLERNINVSFNSPEPPILRNIELADIATINVNATTSIINGTMNFMGNITISCLNNSEKWMFNNVNQFSIEFRAANQGLYAFNITIQVHDETVYNSVKNVYAIDDPSQQPQGQYTLLYVIIAGLAIGMLGVGIAYFRKG